MPNLQPENEVKKKCLSRLEQWQKWGVVLDYDDVSNLGRKNIRGRWIMHTKSGKRDIIALFKVKSDIWVYLIECKAHNGGSWSAEQQEYAKRFEGIKKVVYEVVSDPNQIDNTIDNIVGRTKDLLNEMSNLL